MARKAGIRLSVEPLLNHPHFIADAEEREDFASLSGAGSGVRYDSGRDVIGGSIATPARTFRLTDKQYQSVRTAKARGYLTLDKADEIACSLGMHPIEVWGEEYEAVVWFDMYEETEGIAA